MTASLARQIALAARPNGKPQLSDFRLEETEVPAPASGQLLLAVQYLSLDPYMRGRMDDRKSYAKPLQLGDVRTRADCRRRGVLARFWHLPPARDRWFADSPLEEIGFELVVPWRAASRQGPTNCPAIIIAVDDRNYPQT